MANGLGRLLLLLVASTVVLLQTVIWADNHDGYDGFSAWALICSIVSAGLCGTVYVIQLLAPEKCIGAEGMKYVAFFLTCIWVGGTGCMTVKSPYPVPGNGYFAAWAALLGSMLLLLEFIPQVRAPFDRLVVDGAGCLAIVLLSSAAVLVQTLYLWTWVGNGWQWSAAAVWTTVCSSLSLLFCTVLILIGPVNAAARPHWKAIALAFFVWWAIGTSVATFINPYTLTGNGYFGCWAALLATGVLAARAWQVTGGVADMLQHASLMAGGTPTEFVVTFIASVVTLVAAAVVCDKGDCRGYDAWAVVCSVISIVTCLVVFICKAGVWDSPSFDSNIPMISTFLFTIWLAGTGFMTLQAPFRETGNGYFGAWAALISSWLLTSRSFPVLKQCLQTIGSHSIEMAVLLLASATLLLQASVDCGSSDAPCTENRAWAAACGAVSLVVCIVIVASFEQIQCAFSWIALALSIWWFAGVGFLTFSWPYTTASSAYFACWAGSCASLVMVCKEFPRLTGGVASTVMAAGVSIENAAVGGGMRRPNLVESKAPTVPCEKPVVWTTEREAPAASVMGAPLPAPYDNA